MSNVWRALRALLRLHPAEPPTNVRVTTVAGDVIPVDLVYTGRRGGMHIWQATAPAWIGNAADGWGIHADAIPPHTSIVLTIAGTT